MESGVGLIEGPVRSHSSIGEQEVEISVCDTPGLNLAHRTASSIQVM
jgi:hypothetical protein